MHITGCPLVWVVWYIRWTLMHVCSIQWSCDAWPMQITGCPLLVVVQCTSWPQSQCGLYIAQLNIGTIHGHGMFYTHYSLSIISGLPLYRVSSSHLDVGSRHWPCDTYFMYIRGWPITCWEPTWMNKLPTNDPSDGPELQTQTSGRINTKTDTYRRVLCISGNWNMNCNWRLHISESPGVMGSE